MKNKFLVYALLPVIVGAGIAGAGYASAHGWFFGFGPAATPETIATRQQSMFETEAQILGISVNELKDAWAEGKTFQQIAKDKGITAEQLRTKIRDLRLQQVKSQIQALVDKGVITQDQANKRLQFLESQPNGASGGSGLKKGFFRHWGFGL